MIDQTTHLPFEPFPVITSERLQFIEIQDIHKEALFAIFGDPEVLTYYNLKPFNEVDDTQLLVDFFAKRKKEGTGIRWGIVEKETNNLIGTIGFLNFEANHRSTIGYELRKDQWGKGVMSEAIARIVQFGFEVLQVNRIEAEVMQGNTGSEIVLEKNGFRKEAILRDWMLWEDRHYDMSMFTLLKKEWESTACEATGDVSSSI